MSTRRKAAPAALAPDPIDQMRRSARRLIVLGGYVYAVRRIRPEELLRQGYVRILATVTAHAQAEAAATEDQRWVDRLAACTTPAQRAAVEADRAAESGQALTRQLGKALEDPEAAKEALAQCDAYIRASVEAIGVAREGIEPGMAPADAAAEDVCEVIGEEGGEPRYLRPVRFVDDTDVRAGQLSLADLDQIERLTLGHLAMIVSSARREIEPFRGRER